MKTAGNYKNEIKKETFYSISQDKIELKTDVKQAKKTTGITQKCDVNKTVENIINVIISVEKSPFV